MDPINKIPEDRLLRMFVWGIASELNRLEGLQEFAVSGTREDDPVNIRQTAKILADAQLKLRRLATHS